MQVEVVVKRMQTNFGGHGYFGFGDIACFCLPSKRLNFPFGPWTIKKGTEPLQELLNKITTEKE